jgi:DNA polymerase I
MSKTLSVDGNYFLHRAMNVVIKRRNPQFLVKNTLTMFLNMISSDAAVLKATHILVCFDAKRSFRHDLYKGYKANRIRGEGTTVTLDNGEEFHTDITPGSLVKPAKEVLDLAGLFYSQKKLYEADDLMASAAVSLPGKIVIDTRDKDLAATVNERVSLYWPVEKKLIGPKEVFKHFGVHPLQITDYLSLLGDKVDNIPGIPGCGPKTACALLLKYGTLDKAIKDPMFRSKYKEHQATLAMARKLVTLRPDVKYDIVDLLPRKVNKDLGDLVWSIPTNLKDLADSRKMTSMKGLFG